MLIQFLVVYNQNIYPVYSVRHVPMYDMILLYDPIPHAGVTTRFGHATMVMPCGD